MTAKEKFLRFCPNCNHYNKSTGICSYINEYVLEEPDMFVKFCDGKYLSLIKGKTIKPVKESEIGDEDEALLVSAFSSNNNALLQVAKSILDDNKIEYFSSGDYINVLNPAAFAFEIKVFEKDGETARKLLSKLKPSQHNPKGKLEKKMLSLKWYWNVVIIIMLILLLIIFFLLLK